ncbi:protein phosphatase inhibitor 2-like [Monodelphis domestica]|uniref:protein phosphatase inhibitor 2-like n=1 Tax=Monodelphis domestica TaxID=13616 RepID=UPI0024E20A8A|nr:protein phosphatase inhibitor 2-like [Monodelphis domestica]
METFTTKHRPIKGILKKSSPGSPILSTMGTGAGAVRGEEFSKKSQKWEELDILATYHHKDKNYEPMNIEEQNPSSHGDPEDSEEEDDDDYDDIRYSAIPHAITPELLSQRLENDQDIEYMLLFRESESSEDEEDHKRRFELKRKLHYREGLNIKFAQQLAMKEDDSQDQEMTDLSEVDNMAMEAWHTTAPNESIQDSEMNSDL